MELTKKQIILIAGISGAILLLTLAAVLLFTPGEEADPPAPTATVQDTATPAPTPTPSPSPTAFRLPLVPQYTPRAGSYDTDAGVFAPWSITPTGTAGPLVEAHH